MNPFDYIYQVTKPLQQHRERFGVSPTNHPHLSGMDRASAILLLTRAIDLIRADTSDDGEGTDLTRFFEENIET